jgi:hypothetical protein
MFHFSFSCRESNAVRAGELIRGWDLCSIMRGINNSMTLSKPMLTCVNSEAELYMGDPSADA